MKWHYAATAKAVMFLTFDIDVFAFTYLDTIQLCWKLWVFGTCVAEKQQSDEELSKVKASRA